MLLGSKGQPARGRDADPAAGIDHVSPAGRSGLDRGDDPDKFKINELREITNWQVPTTSDWCPSRTFNDVKLAVTSGADVVVVDVMQGGTAASHRSASSTTGIPRWRRA